jgi:subfamily B ATP-binding cassette protein MsbA
MQDSMGDMTHILEESINGQKEVKIYGGEVYEQKRFSITSHELRQQMMKIVRVSAANVPIMQSLTAVAMAVVLYIASIMTMDDQLTPGQFIAFITAMSLLFEPLRRLTSINTDLQKGIAASESIFALLDEKIEKDTGNLTLKNVEGDIEFKAVEFTYPETDKVVLDDFNLRIAKDKTTALVGLSGSGKTTIANLIPRFFTAQQGDITINDVNIADFSLESLRKHISYVSQNIVLFNDTIRANIAYGKQADKSLEDIIAAAKAAHAWEFIEKLPQGLDSPIGQNGSKLSGGQRQRIALARAFLKDAPILILDEATSALDNESERHIQQAIENLSVNRTMIVIAHRLSTIENADVIVVMDKGKIVEQGSHQELLNNQEHYAKLYKQSFED